MTTHAHVASVLPVARPRGRAPIVALFRVRLTVDVWALLGGALAAWAIADGAAAPGRSIGTYAAAASGAAVLLLVSLTLHEAAHAVAARRAGLRVTRAVLSLGTGATVLRAEPPTPGDAFRIAVAGPLASFACAGLAAAANIVLVESGADPLGATVAASVASGNVVVGMLNLLPGLPLDGGHVLRAALWACTGRPAFATSTTLAASRALAGLLIAVALVASTSGDGALGIWLGFLGLAIAGSRG